MKKNVSILLVLAMCLSLCACGGASKYEKYDTLIGYIESDDAEAALSEVMRLMHEDDAPKAESDADELSGEEAALAMLCKTWELTDWERNVVETATFNSDGTCKIGDKSGVYTTQYYEYDSGNADMSISIKIGEEEWRATMYPSCKIDEQFLSVSDSEWNSVGTVYKTMDMAADKEKYDYIVGKLGEYNQFKEMDYYAVGNDDLKIYYDVLTALGDFEDAQAILARFTILDNVLLKEVQVSTDSFGQTSSYDRQNYIYDKYGNQIPYNYNLMEVKYSGERISEIILGYNGTIESKYVYEYDVAGNLISESNISNYGSADVITYTYHGAGQIATEKNGGTWSDGSEKNGDTYVYEYNEAGLKVAKATTEDNYNTKYTYTYDSQNRLLEEIRWESDYQNEYEGYEKYIYNYSNDGNMSYTFYRYSNDTWQEQYTMEFVYGTYYVYTVE